MSKGGPASERVLVLAPNGRDSEVASRLLRVAGRHTFTCASLAQMCDELEKGAAFSLITEEALAHSDLTRLRDWVAAQPPWSDLPIVLLTGQADSPERNAQAAHYQDILGNVTYLERPFHPTTLVSIARAAVRSRRRQYEARDSIDRYMLLSRELQHRTKNMLAVIQAIASASLPAGEGRLTYFARLHALAKAQDLFLEGDGRGTSMAHLVEQALESFGRRMTREGPDVFLSATTAQGFALILHELATNAAKHGALSADQGTVHVRWAVESSAPPRLSFYWEERGGPPAFSPARTGFGSLLLTHAVPSAEGPPLFDYSHTGFKYQITTQLDRQSPPPEPFV
jgi:two-component sensor histidine kinase